MQAYRVFYGRGQSSLERFERKFLQVTGTPDPAVFRAEDHKKAMHFGRLE